MFATSSSEKDVARIGAMDGRVAHSARLVLGGLIVSGSGRAQHREGMTLQAQQIDLAYPQVARII